MAAEYTVRQIVSQEDYDFPGDDGQVFLTSYALMVDGPQANGFDPVTMTVAHDRRKDGDAPAPGETIFGDIVKGKRGYKLKRANKRDQDRTPFDKGNAGYRQQDNPETIARITRSHSQHMAVLFAVGTGDLTELDLTNHTDVQALLSGALTPVIDFFDRDKQQAAERAQNGSQPELSKADESIAF
jgi:hypothetical protein